MGKLIFLLLFFPMSGLAQADAKTQIANAENSFKEMASSKGIAEAFYFYADEHAVIKRENDTLIKGRDAIRNYYSKIKNASVVWTPDFIEASKDGTMGYTYGKYTWTIQDASGKSTDHHGVFHTVWKKQPDGSWKYIWD